MDAEKDQRRDQEPHQQHGTGILVRRLEHEQAQEDQPDHQQPGPADGQELTEVVLPASRLIQPGEVEDKQAAQTGDNHHDIIVVALQRVIGPDQQRHQRDHHAHVHQAQNLDQPGTGLAQFEFQLNGHGSSLAKAARCINLEHSRIVRSSSKAEVSSFGTARFAQVAKFAKENILKSRERAAFQKHCSP